MFRAFEACRGPPRTPPAQASSLIDSFSSAASQVNRNSPIDGVALFPSSSSPSSSSSSTPEQKLTSSSGGGWWSRSSSASTSTSTSSSSSSSSSSWGSFLGGIVGRGKRGDQEDPNSPVRRAPPPAAKDGTNASPSDNRGGFSPVRRTAEPAPEPTTATAVATVTDATDSSAILAAAAVAGAAASAAQASIAEGEGLGGTLENVAESVWGARGATSLLEMGVPGAAGFIAGTMSRNFANRIASYGLMFGGVMVMLSSRGYVRVDVDSERIAGDLQSAFNVQQGTSWHAFAARRTGLDPSSLRFGAHGTALVAGFVAGWRFKVF